MKTVEELKILAEKYTDDFENNKEMLETIQHTSPHYFRKTLFKDDDLEVVLVCFDELQSTTLHNHGGGNCVMRCISGRVIEHTYYKKWLSSDLEYQSMRMINEKDIVHSPFLAYHHVVNVNRQGSVLLNFYSPPLPPLDVEKPK